MADSRKTKILMAAQGVFLRYGYKRVSMNDIAEASGISRPALYVVFKNKEEIFIGVFLRWVDETIAEIERGMAALPAPEDQLEHAFEVWTVRPFGMMLASPEAKELLDCAFGFAQDPLRQAYKRFEAALVPVLASLARDRPPRSGMAPEQIAHVLASAARGFKQAAATQPEIRLLISQLLALSLGTSGPGAPPAQTP